MPRQKKNTQRISVFLDPEAESDLRAMAEAQGLNLSSLIRMILLEWLDVHS